MASPATSSTIIMSSTWASVVPAGTVPKDYPRHFDGLSARPGASVSRRSPRSRAHRGHRAGFLRVGRGVDQGQRRPRAGHSRRLWERLWERRLELGANTYRVLVPPTSTEMALVVRDPRGPARARSRFLAAHHHIISWLWSLTPSPQRFPTRVSWRNVAPDANPKNSVSTPVPNISSTGYCRTCLLRGGP